MGFLWAIERISNQALVIPCDCTGAFYLALRLTNHQDTLLNLLKSSDNKGRYSFKLPESCLIL